MAGNNDPAQACSECMRAALALEKIFQPGHRRAYLQQSSRILRPSKNFKFRSCYAVPLTGSERGSWWFLAGALLKISHGTRRIRCLIILPDASMKKGFCCFTCMLNAGQSASVPSDTSFCGSHAEHAGTDHSMDAIVGDPFDDTITMGPMARLDLVNTLENKSEDLKIRCHWS
jgi:hypothetical protein